MSNRSTIQTPVTRVHSSGAVTTETDLIAAEEPLEIRVDGRPVAITMRTPGHDLELVAGFLFTEGVIDGPDDIHALAHVDDPSSPRGNTVDTVLAAGVPAGRRHNADRAMYASSSCGVCGKQTLDRLMTIAPPLERHLDPAPELLTVLPGRLREEQAVFDQTGGLHAAALFTPEGDLEVAREDIGRHNAVDKVVGWRLLADRVPVDDRILMVSGRVGFEIVQKALVARIPVVAAVGAPSSLAVQLANRAGMQLIGFLRDGRYNRYSD